MVASNLPAMNTDEQLRNGLTACTILKRLHQSVATANLSYSRKGEGAESNQPSRAGEEFPETFFFSLFLA
jgi:hypothetical protein